MSVKAKGIRRAKSKIPDNWIEFKVFLRIIAKVRDWAKSDPLLNAIVCSYQYSTQELVISPNRFNDIVNKDKDVSERVKYLIMQPNGRQEMQAYHDSVFAHFTEEFRKERAVAR